jgi:hypothetical protein
MSAIACHHEVALHLVDQCEQKRDLHEELAIE